VLNEVYRFVFLQSPGYEDRWDAQLVRCSYEDRFHVRHFAYVDLHILKPLNPFLHELLP